MDHSASEQPPGLLFGECQSAPKLDIYIQVLQNYKNHEVYDQHYGRKIFLDAIAEYMGIEKKRLAVGSEPAQMYKYRITRRSICLAVRSGWTPSDIVAELRNLAVPGTDVPVPISTFVLNKSEYLSEYDVVIRAAQHVQNTDPALFFC